jgi:hypothetical protein
MSLDSFGAQLSIDLASAIDAVILFAFFDHLFPAFGGWLRHIWLDCFGA